MSRGTSLLLGLAGALALGGACSAAGDGNVFNTGGGKNSSANGGNGGGSDVGGSFVNSSGTGTSSSPSTCTNDPNIDGDNDGWTGAEGDCNDCDPNVNPGAIEVSTIAGTQPSDEDCDGHVDNVGTTCDDNLQLGDTNAMNGAKAIDICQQTTANPANKKDRKWGVYDAKYVRANGSTYSPGAQVGIQPSWGNNVHVQGGKNMLAISSGFARTTTQNGACGALSCSSNLLGTPPAGFPQDNPNCPPSAEINDDVGLQLKMRSPTNATGYSFNFKFYSFEYPEWVCNDYNDQFIALVTPAPQGSINGNISFDSNHNAVSVNIAFFDVCDPAGIGAFASFCIFGNCPSPPNPYCPSGKAELAGTGFDVWNDAGATSWLKSQAPVKGGSDVTIRFAIWDTGDDAYDSTALIDNFQWIANGGTVTVSTDPVGTPK